MTAEHRDIQNRISVNYDKMSKGHKRIADFILREFDRVPFMTASSISKMVGISESTVVRFANALGYTGYPGMQHAFQESIKNRLTTTQRFELSKDLTSEDNIIRKVLQSDIDNISKTAETIDADVLKKVVQEIRRARKVYILGKRSSKVLAEYFAFYLNFIVEDIHLLSSGASDLFDELINIDARDLLIVFSFPRYANRTFEVVQFAKRQQATIVGITDSVNSPLVEYAKYALTAKHDMSTFIDSFVAPMSLVNALIIALTVGQREELKRKFDILEETWDLYDVYR